MEIDAVKLKKDLPGSNAGTYGYPHLDRWDFSTDDGGFHAFTTYEIEKNKSWFLIIPKLNIGDYVTILYRPRSWSSACNHNYPRPLNYPRSGSISKMKRESHDDSGILDNISLEITFPDGSYGFDLNSLFDDGIIKLEKNIDYTIGSYYWDKLAESAVLVVDDKDYKANVGKVTIAFVKKNSWRFRRLATDQERVDKAYVAGVDPYADNKKTDVLLVRITGSKPGFWYNNLEGYLFFAYEYGNFYHVLDYATVVKGIDYSVKGIEIDTSTNMHRTIYKDDAEVVSKINL